MSVNIRAENIFDPMIKAHQDLIATYLNQNKDTYTECLNMLHRNMKYYMNENDYDSISKMQDNEMCLHLMNEDYGCDYAVIEFVQNAINQDYGMATSKLCWDSGWYILESKELGLTRHIQDLGFDGIKTYERVDYPDEYTYNIAVFDPTQIKSIHNRGTFEPNNPNILEKNDYGMHQIEKVLSIIPNDMSIDKVKNYLTFNGISREHLRGTIYQDCLNNETFNNPVRVDKNIDTESSYYKNLGEKESREIEDKYINQNLTDAEKYVANFANETENQILKIN